MTNAVFAGFDASGELDPWVTDGTPARTSELVASGTGLFAGVTTPDFTVLGNTILFAGASGFGAVGLWVTNGTPAGTTELRIPGSAGGTDIFVGGFDPDFTVLGSKALFVGVDASVHTNLWVTDGTAAGTQELSTPAAYSGGLFVNLPNPDFTVFGTKVLFAGDDATSGIHLWVSDGTSAGTHELTVAGANPSGLFGPLEINPDFTVLGGKVLFEGAGSLGNPGLWVTDGTSAGTSELAVSDADPLGLFVNGLSPDFTVLNGKVLFEGMAANGFLFSGLPNLWVTDGTAAGTTELSVAGANPGGLFSSVNANFTVLGSKALFEAEDAAGHVNLWVTDGTSAGTSELAVAGANHNGMFSSTNPDFTVFGGKVLFAGEDSNGNANLWITDGTAAGTSELPVAGASSGGLRPFDLTVFGVSKVLFQGVDASGNINWWITDATSAGTSEFSVGGASSGGLAPSDITVLASIPPPRLSSATATRDFNIDGDSDLLWQDSSGQVVIWEMSGATVLASGSAGNPGPDWRAVGTGDFNGDRLSDILFQSSSGQVVIWEESGATVIASGSAGNPGPSWHAIGAGDFNGDGLSDILFQNSTGQVVIWEQSGATVIASGSAGNPGPSWHAVGTGDFNRDGLSDILFQNSTGEVVIWEMSGATVIASGSAGNPGPNWHVVGTGDFNGDGLSDILFQNSTGQVVIWEMSGATVIASGSAGNPGPGWHAVGIGDYNGDGLSDIRFQNSTGQVVIWEMSGATVIASGSAGKSGAELALDGRQQPVFPW